MKTHKQELLDLASDFKKANEVTVAMLSDDRAPIDRAVLPKNYVSWVVKALKESAERCKT